MRIYTLNICVAEGKFSKEKKNEYVMYIQIKLLESLLEV